MSDASTHPAGDAIGETPDWFKTAVFYEVLVRSFRDSNADGTWPTGGRRP